MRLILSGIALGMLLGFSQPARVLAQVASDSVSDLKGLEIDEHLGQKIPLNLTFTDDQGQTVTLAKYFNQGRPVILNMVYYQCPMLCSFVLNGVTDGLKKLPWNPGKEYQLLTISFNPGETSDLAAAKKANYLHELAKPGADAGWAFLVGPAENSRAVADALGFKYRYLPEQKQYAHTAATFIVAPDGTISRYLYGLDYQERDLRLALLEASEGKIGNTIDKLVLYCYHYDPQAKGYVVFATNIMKLGGVLVLLALVIVIGLLWRHERRGHRGTRPALRHG